jgi:hypothetical protein
VDDDVGNWADKLNLPDALSAVSNLVDSDLLISLSIDARRL